MTRNANTAINCLALALAMLGLAYASVPLYDLFCRVMGYGGTTQVALHAPGAVGGNKRIHIRFNADTNADLPWAFAPGETAIDVRVGEQNLTHYVAENKSDKPVTGTAIYNVVPHGAGMYFMKIACFCFEEQTLSAKQKVDMPVSFFVDPKILDDPEMKDVDTITLSYTFFPVKK